MTILREDKRGELISRGRRGVKEKSDGKSRYEKRVNSRVASAVKEFNQIDMESLFKYSILTVNVPVRGETGNYIVRIKFGGFLDELHKLVNQTGKFDLKSTIKALTNCFDRDDVYIHCTCLHPDTAVRLADGTSPKVSELLERFNSGEKLYTYSWDGQRLVVSEIERVWITGRSSIFLKIVLDTDKEVITTPDHKYLTQEGKYLPASSLYVGQQLTNGTTVKLIEDIRLPNDIPTFDIKIKDIPNFLTDAGVILHNCSDFQYRFSFWASINKITSGTPENRPSKITNPYNDLGPGCKHIMLVLSNNKWVVKVASTIFNYVNYMEKNRKQQYADIIYPAIYNKKYNEPVQLSLSDKDTLDTDAELIDTANIQGKTRGQFKAGNPYRFQRKPGPGVGQIPIQGED